MSFKTLSYCTTTSMKDSSSFSKESCFYYEIASIFCRSLFRKNLYYHKIPYHFLHFFFKKSGLSLIAFLFFFPAFSETLLLSPGEKKSLELPPDRLIRIGDKKNCLSFLPRESCNPSRKTGRPNSPQSGEQSV